MKQKYTYILFFIFFIIFSILFYFILPQYILKVPYLVIILSYFSVYSLKFFLLIFLFFIFKIIGNLVVYPLSLSFLKKVTNDEDDIDSFKKVFSFIWWTIYLIILVIIFVGFTKLGTSIGLIGLGLSLAFQRPILNILGWFTLVTKQLYKEGERIEVFAQRSIQLIRGDVKEINLFHTILEGLYKDTEMKSGKIISFPNEFILFSEIRNYSKESNYILHEVSVNITIDSNYEKAREIFEKSLRKVVTRHSKEYLKKIKKERIDLENEIKNLLMKKKKDKDMIEIQKLEISEKSLELENEIKKVEELNPDHFLKVYVEINSEGSIKLVGNYLVLYTLVKKSNTEIVLNFLENIKEEKDIHFFVVK